MIRSGYGCSYIVPASIYIRYTLYNLFSYCVNISRAAQEVEDSGVWLHSFFPCDFVAMPKLFARSDYSDLNLTDKDFRVYGLRPLSYSLSGTR